MKTLAFSVPALLATLAYTSVVAAAEAPATVYFFSHGRPSTSSIVNNNNRPSLNLKETRAALAHLLNLGQGHNHPNRNRDESFIDMRGPIQQVFSQPGMARKDLFETPGGNLMMVIEGVQNPHDVLPTFDPAFTVDSTKGLQDMITEFGFTVPEKDRYLFDTHKSSKSGVALVNEHLVAEHHANVDVTVFDLTKRADALFLEESVSLANFFEQYEKGHRNQEPNFIRITIKGLAALADEHGLGSVQYKNAQQILKEFLQTTLIPEFEQIHKTYTVSLFVISPSHNREMGSESFEASSNPFLTSSPLRKRALPASGSTCFATEADCQANTNGCNEHGTCVLSQAANCYHCKCSKINTTQYGGPKCDKIDVSVQFHLFFWLGLGLLLLVATAVGLIIQMGSQSQGGIAVGPTRAQLKRD
ncbi:hypothetical protein BGX34_003558 [Mortierella sp. NVP85]|nr:hypothetical protein BGX34_003558 [Mortierella sp. NVP85]